MPLYQLTEIIKIHSQYFIIIWWTDLPLWRREHPGYKQVSVCALSFFFKMIFFLTSACRLLVLASFILYCSLPILKHHPLTCLLIHSFIHLASVLVQSARHTCLTQWLASRTIQRPTGIWKFPCNLEAMPNTHCLPPANFRGRPWMW